MHPASILRHNLDTLNSARANTLPVRYPPVVTGEDLMSDPSSDPPESAEYSVPPAPRSAREKQRWRNAAARRKLEARRERKLLRRQLTDVWDEPVNNQ